MMEWCCLYCPQKDHFLSEDFKEGTGKSDKALPLHVIMKGMAQGTVMYKVRAPDRWYRRKYKVDIQNMRLSYAPSNKPFWKTKLIKVCKCSYSGLLTNIVDLYELEEVRKGWNTDVFNNLEAKFRRHLQATFHPQLRSMLKEDNCFSLIVGPGHAVVDLITANIHTRDAWVRGLSQLIASCKSTKMKHEHDRWLKEQVRKADINSNGSLNFEECLLLLNQLNISMSKKEARVHFDASNFRKVKIEGEDALEPDEFVQFYHSLNHRPELEEIMKKYSVSRSALWGPEELQNFLHIEQNVVASMDECESFIERYEPEENKIDGFLTLKGFEEMMLSVEHDIFNKKHRLIYQNMNHPLNHYYIATSHNTYLLQGQLIGESSIEGYIKALNRGCRCLELDIWDGPNGEPIVFHGYTLTSRILFRDILDAIKQYAFRASQYPVILSLENHCSLPQQIRMAFYLITILGEYLYKAPVDEIEVEFPSPETLARKIFIKAKKLSPEVEAAEEFLLEEEEEREEMVAAAAASSNEANDDENEPAFAPPMAAPEHSKGIAVELSNLVNYCAARRFKSFDQCKNEWRFCEMASFSETISLDFGQNHALKFVAHNKRHLSRIYPKGLRTDSSNYDPIPHWNMGCQMVALNYQTWDKPMYIHESKFAQNGRCGYVLKPKYLCDKDALYDPDQSPLSGHDLRLTVKIISGQRLPKPNRSLEGEVVDPYVSVKVIGHPLDKKKYKTRFIRNNGFNPAWNEEFQFVLCAPEQAMILFRVKDQNATGSNELLGQFGLPFSSITEGYRHVHLQDSKGQSLIPATIFIHVKFAHHVQQATR